MYRLAFGRGSAHTQKKNKLTYAAVVKSKPFLV